MCVCLAGEAVKDGGEAVEAGGGKNGKTQNQPARALTPPCFHSVFFRNAPSKFTPALAGGRGSGSGLPDAKERKKE